MAAKTCARAACGRRFWPRSNRQLFCNENCRELERGAYRKLSSPLPVSLPERMCACGCGTVFQPKNWRHQFAKPAHRANARRGLLKARYGRQHRDDRHGWAPLVRTGTVGCARCRLPIEEGEAWDLDHLEDGTSRPSHARCNRAEPMRTHGRRNSRRW